MKLAACASLERRPENAVWFRAIQPQHWQTALATEQTTAGPSRYSPANPTNPSFPILYLAENHFVALREVGALLVLPSQGGLLPHPRLTWTILNVKVVLQAVVDLTDVVSQAALDTTVQELTGDWEGYHERSPLTSVSSPTGLAPTQVLGEALHAVPGLEGFRAVSAKQTTYKNLVIFPDKLLPGSSVVFHHAETGQTHSIAPPKRRAKGARR